MKKKDSKFGIYIKNPQPCKNINQIFEGKLLEFQEKYSAECRNRFQISEACFTALAF
jgi:hypothetical protein